MKAPSRRKAFGAAFGFVACCAVVLFFLFGGTILDTLQRASRKFDHQLGCHLATCHGIVSLADFDEAVPIDLVSGAPVTFWDTPRVEGRFGWARRINLDRNPEIQLPMSQHAGLANEATFAGWFKPYDVHRRQTIFGQKNNGSNFKLVLEGGNLHLSVADGATNVFASCRFVGEPGRFSHVALTIEAGQAAIWQDGRETARLSFSNPIVLSSRMPAFGVGLHCPFEGDIDDLAVWNRALPPKELKDISSSSFDVRRRYAPWLSLLADLVRNGTRFIDGFYRSVGRLAPPILNPAPIAKDIPKVTIWASNKDARHFLFAHSKSLQNGYRTEKASDFRNMNVSFGDRTVQAEVCLDDVYGRSDDRRMAFIVRDATGTVLKGSSMVRLYPPEAHVAFHPDAPYPLPLDGSFVRLFLEDSFKGLYVMEPLERTGSAWMARGRRNAAFERALYYRSAPAPCDVPPAGVDPEVAYSATAALALSDTLFPWGRQELHARKVTHARRRAEDRFDPVPEPDALLRRVTAGNLSPLFVTDDLDFDTPGFAWESSDPDLVSADGRVSRPPNGAPRPVTLTPVAADGTRGEPRRIRVVPVAPDLQTLFLHVGLPPEKHRRSDFVCLRFPAGGGDPEWITGFGGSNGGIKHRGNTSYVKGAKRSFSLEIDEKVAWPGSSRPACHVLLFSGYADSTRLRNKVSFDSFRVAATEDVPCGATDISWSEVFINGEYFGVWETCRRVKDICDPKTYLYKVRAKEANLWKTTDSDMTECVSACDPRANPYGPLEDLFAFTSAASRDEFAQRFESMFHVGTVIDYLLMLNFTQNYDGQVTNQYIGRRRDDSRWFIIPWDYDKTFFDDRTNHLSNPLVNRAWHDVPWFRGRVCEKWKMLREGPMSTEAVVGRIDEDAALLAPYMEEEYRLLQPAGWDGTFAESVDQLKKVVVERLALMDKKFAPAAK